MKPAVVLIDFIEEVVLLAFAQDEVLAVKQIGGGHLLGKVAGLGVVEVRAAAGEMQRMGIGGVPFFIFNKRLAASGAQPPDALLKAMREATTAAT